MQSNEYNQGISAEEGMVAPQGEYDYGEEPMPEPEYVEELASDNGYVEELVPELDFVQQPPPQDQYIDEPVPAQDMPPAEYDQYQYAEEPLAAQDMAPSEPPPPPPVPPKKQVSYSDDLLGSQPNASVKGVFGGPDAAIHDTSEISSHPSEADPRPKSKQDQEREKRMKRASLYPSTYTVGGNLKKKHYFIRFMKCGGMTICVVSSIFIVSYFILFGFGPAAEPEPESGEPEYQIQQVLPGRLQSLSVSGNVAAIKDDFDFVQIYNHTGSPEAPFWKRMGQPFNVIGQVSLSGNGTVIAFVDKADRRPHILGFDAEREIWLERDAPLIICDEVSMNIDATVLSIGVYNRLDIGAWQDFIAAYRYDGSEWKEFSSRLELGTINGFEMSPTARFLVASTPPETGDASSIVNIYMLSELNDEDSWTKLDTEIRLDGTPAFDLAEDVFAVASQDVLTVYSYSGRVWGQDLFPRDNSTFASVALTLDGRTLAVGDISGDNTGIVNRYTYPWTADTGDDWEETGPPLEYDWQLDEGYIRDEYGNEAPVFGTRISLDGDGSTIAIQSGLEGNQNVHFYDILPPMDEEDEEEE